MNPVESYLTELARKLDGKLPRELAEARLREVRAHLAEAMRHEDEANALRRFGPPSATARAILRQARGDDARSSLALSWAVGIALAAAFTVPNFSMNRRPDGSALQFQISVWLPFLAVLVFAARCLRTRRWLAFPVTAWAAAGIALVFLLPALFPARLDAKERKQRLGWARELVAELDRSAREVAAWRAGRPPTDAFPYTFRPDHSLYIAGIPIPIHLEGGPEYGIQRFETSVAESAQAWQEFGPSWSTEVAKRRREALEGLANTEAGFYRPLSTPADKLRYGLIGIAQIAAVLFASNGLALLLGRMLDALPPRRRRKAAG